jgi:hypothetical protein
VRPLADKTIKYNTLNRPSSIFFGFSTLYSFAIGIDDETLDTYRWLFDAIFTETGISPGVIFTDSDPSMIQSIKEIYLNTKHLLCIFHIDLNLRKKLQGKLGNKFENFTISSIHAEIFFVKTYLNFDGIN